MHAHTKRPEALHPFLAGTSEFQVAMHVAAEGERLLACSCLGGGLHRSHAFVDAQGWACSSCLQRGLHVLAALTLLAAA